MKGSLLVTLIALAACSFGSQVLAADIIADTPLQVASGGLAPGSPVDYTFFGGIQPTLLTHFTVSIAGDTLYPGYSGYSSVTAPDGTGPFFTGIAHTGPPAPETKVVATFSPLFDGDFTVWVLDGNTDGNSVGNASVGLGVNGGTEVSTATVYSHTNEFTPYTVTGALTTDVFQVYATTDTANLPSLGGLTFELPTDVPEPSSLVVCGLGVGGIFLRLRACRRRKG